MMLVNDDVKSQYEKDSDGGEMGSPASQDEHQHQHPFSDENEVEKRDDPSAGTFDAENKSLEEVKVELEGSQQTGLMDKGADESVMEPENEEVYESKNITIEQVESTKKSKSLDDSSSNSSSSSSSSDDESQVTAEKELARPSDDPVKPVDSLTEDTPVEEVNNSVAENVPDLNSLKQPEVSVSEEVIHVSESAPVENLVVSNGVELESKKNGEEWLPNLAEVTEVPLPITDFESKRVDDKVPPLTDEKAESSSNVVEYTSEENGGKPLSSTVPPGAGTTNGAEHSKDTEFSECSENKPLVASAPRPVQTTSWKSCCGLFEVLSGSH